MELPTAITIDRAGFDVQLKLLMRAITMFDGALDLFRQAITHGDPNFIPLVRMLPDFNIQHSRLPKGTLIDDAIYQLISLMRLANTEISLINPADRHVDCENGFAAVERRPR